MTSYSGKVTGSGGKGFSAELRVSGLDETIAALRALEPLLLKEMQAEMKRAAGKVASGASRSFARTGHGSGEYKVRSSARGKRTGMRVTAAGKEEAIFELAGTKMRSRSGGPITPQGAAMVRWLDGFGKPGRFLWDTWNEQKTVFERDLKAAIDGAEHELQARLDAAGERY